MELTFVQRFGSGEWAGFHPAGALHLYAREWALFRKALPEDVPMEALGVLPSDAPTVAHALHARVAALIDEDGFRAALERALRAGPPSWHHDYFRLRDTFRAADGVTVQRGPTSWDGTQDVFLVPDLHPILDPPAGFAVRAYPPQGNGAPCAYGVVRAQARLAAYREVLPRSVDRVFQTVDGHRLPALTLLPGAALDAVAATYDALGTTAARNVLGALLRDHLPVYVLARTQAMTHLQRWSAMAHIFREWES